MSWQQVLLDRFYNRERGWVGGTEEFWSMCTDHIPLGSRILEIGAGPSNATSDFLATRGNVIGLDVDGDAQHNKALKESHVLKGLRFPFDDDSFDACVSNYVVEHIQDPIAHLREVNRVLRRGGRYMIRTPNKHHYVSIIARLTPHWFHEAVANRARNLADDAHEPYPTFHRLNSRKAMLAAAAVASLQVLELRMVEKEPSYGMASPLLFLPFMAYERLVNSTELAANLRANLFVVMHKHIAQVQIQSTRP